MEEISGSPATQRKRMFALLSLLKEFETTEIKGFENKFESYGKEGVPLDDLFAEYMYRLGGSTHTLRNSYLDPLLKKGEIVEVRPNILHSKEFLGRQKKEKATVRKDHFGGK